MEDQSRPVTGYPPGHSQAQPSTGSHPNGYPPAQTAYPYAAPPPYNPNAYYAPPPYTNPRATFLRRFVAAVIAVFIITGTVIFILWLVLRPRLPEFRVDSVSVSSFNVSDSQVTGYWDVRFSVRNPNKKMSIAYDNIQASVFYKVAFLSETTIVPFYQSTKNQTTVTAKFAALQAYVDGRIASLINGDRTRGTVSFNVKMVARVRFKAGAWGARRRLMRVLCEELTVGFSSNSGAGKLVGGSRECRVGL